MNFDNSWDAVLKPGKATLYFDKLSDLKFEADATSYSKINAWWLAELCRLIYREDIDESGDATGPSRQEILESVNLQEVEFFNEGDTEAALIKPMNSSSFAALIFRGTTDLMDWLTDFRAFPVSWPAGGFVHEGFAEAIELVQSRITASLKQNVPSGCPLFIAGHSLGAALATLAASLFKPRVLYDFGSPRVGDGEFAQSLNGISIYRVVNNRDVVTVVPPPVPFHHIGELHYITHDGDVLTNPDDDTVARDRLKRDRRAFFPDWHKLFTDAPEPIADHAPVNYVAHLERSVEI